MTGDSFHLLAIDVPLAFVLASPCLLFASARKRRNAPLVVPAVVLFVLGMSSLYVALIEGPSTAPVFQNLRPDLALLWHQHDLTYLTVSTLLAATVMFVLGLLYCDAIMIGVWRKHLAAMFAVFGTVYGACMIWLLMSAHVGASLARHISQHLRP